jgi:hypothetical protein
LSAVLLNRHVSDVPTHNGQRSRGLIIPQLLAFAVLPHGLPKILQVLQETDLALYGPFTLALFDANTRRVISFESDGKEHEMKARSWEPFFFTSSSVDFEAVRAYRQARFKSFFVESSATTSKERLVRFHLERFTGFESKSLLMSREDARTVSLSIIEYSSAGVEFSYAAIPEKIKPHWQPNFDMYRLCDPKLTTKDSEIL